MEKKMVFLDLDGTLLDQNNQIVPSAKESIDLLKRNGTFVAIATGRAPFMFAHIREELNINSFISFNGQYVVKEGEPVYRNPLDAESFERLNKEAGKNEHPMVYLNHEEMKANLSEHRYIHDSLSSLDFIYPKVDVSFFKRQDIYQALLFCKGTEENLYKQKFKNFEMIRWHEYSVDVIPAGGSKAEGIKQLLDHFGVDRTNAIAFGDGLNDIQMLDFVGTGVAMGNAAPEAKKAADFVTKKASEDGIAYGLKELNLIK